MRTGNERAPRHRLVGVLMPMNNALRVPLYRILVELRPTWSDAETNSATIELAKQDGDPFTLILQAVAQARKASNDRAISITWPLQAEAVVRTLTTRLPDRSRCPEHDNDRINAVTGEWSCCLNEQAGEPAPRQGRRPSKPPAEALRLLELARNGSKEQQK